VTDPNARPAVSDHGRSAVPWTVASVVVGAGIVVLETRLTRMGGLGGGRFRLLAGLLLWWALLLPAWLLLRRVGRRTAILVILLGAIALPSAAMTKSVQISDDVFRYSWDGRVQAAGVDPYRYPPVADELRRFRDPWLWPGDATCASIGRAERPCTRINRLEVRTIYPPVAEGWFYVMHELPGPARDAHQRLYASLLSVALALLLIVVLPKLGRDPRWAMLYAWSPVAGFDIATDAHVDVLAGLFAVGAVVLAARRPEVPTRLGRRGRSVASAVLAGAAIAVKLYPALLLPALVTPVRDVRRGIRALAFAAVAIGFVLLTYVPHVLAVGPDVLGYLPGYLQEEQYGGKATRYLVLGLLHLPATATQVLAVLTLVVAVLVTLRSRAPVPARAVGLVGSAFLVATPVQPWYALLLIVLAVLAARPEWLLVAAAAYPAYFSAVLRDDRFVGIGQLSYGLAAAGVLAVTLWRLSVRDVTGDAMTQPSGPLPAKSQLSTAEQHG
jgi:hypothetical protein